MFPRLGRLSVIRAGRVPWGSPRSGFPAWDVCPGAGPVRRCRYSNGMSWAPVTARLLAEPIAEGGTALAQARLDPARFAGQCRPQTYDYTGIAEYLGRVG